MKKMIWWALVGLMPAASQAALSVYVDIDAPQLFQLEQNVIVANALDPANEGANTNDEQLIWLGLHETTGFNANSNDNTVTVHVQNMSGGSLDAVSLVLSAYEALNWNFVLDSGVTLSNIFVFSVFEQSFSGAVTATDTTTFTLAPVCGYAVDPADFGGCRTDEILGTTGIPFGPNYLDALTPTLAVTNFNGAYAGNGFTVQLTAVPLPGATLLFCSAISLILIARRTPFAASSRSR
jgi:hypothetical protein